MDTNIIISTIALFASIYAIYSTRIDVKKQLRLSKLEEVLEIITFMQGYYLSLFWLFHDVKELDEAVKKGEKMTSKMEHTIKAQSEFREIVTTEMIIEKTTRLVTLSNAYLPNINNLKLKVYTLSTLYYNMYHYIAKVDSSEKQELSIIPKPGEMEKFILRVEQLIIAEMNLGYKNVTKKQRREYFEKHFKNDIENK